MLGPVHGGRGKQYLRQRISGFNQAAANAHWLVVVDLDEDYSCAAALKSHWLTAPSEGMIFRIAVREVEAWLLADREGIAEFLGVSTNRVPDQPELHPSPKRLIVDLARASKRRAIREGLAPRAGAGREVGPEYVARISEFAAGPWRPTVAEKSADSLRRCLLRLREVHSAVAK